MSDYKERVKNICSAKGLKVEELSENEQFQKATGVNIELDEDHKEWVTPTGIAAEPPAGSSEGGDTPTPDPDPQPEPVKPETVDDITNMDAETAAETDIDVSNVINEMGTSTVYFKTVQVSGTDEQPVTVDQSVTLRGIDKVSIDNINITGGKGSSNGKVIFATKELELSNITADEETQIYNAFEGAGATDDNYQGIEKVTVTNMHIISPDSLKHNAVNVYTPAEGCEILFKDCEFDMNVSTSNALRLANYLNKDNVKVTFENVNWNYSKGSDWDYAGLVLYQPAGGDVARNGNIDHIATWTFTFKNCKYNGELVDANNFGEHNQVVYFYDINKSGAVSNPADVEGVTITFDNTASSID